MENNIVPRYEFRVFENDLDDLHKKLKSFSSLGNVRKSDEFYIVSEDVDHLNIKIRDSRLDIKRLVSETEGFELWYPELKLEFPLYGDMILNKIMLQLGFEMQNFENKSFSEPELIKMIEEASGQVKIAKVSKKRYGYEVNGCVSEWADLFIEDHHIETISIESESLTQLQQTIEMIGMTQFKNINYIAAVKTMIGLKGI